MNNPIKRFSIALDNPWFGNGAYVSEDGHYVLHSDYAALAAENERLRSKLNFSQSISETCKQLHEGETITVQGAISSGKTILSCPCQCERLTAENERLRNAGNEMYQTAVEDSTGLWIADAFEKWHKMNDPRTERGLPKSDVS